MDIRQHKILLVANVAKEHILKFHIPTIRVFKEHGWIVDVACSGDEEIPFCNRQYRMRWKRSPFTYKTILGIFDLKNIIDNESYDIIYCHTPVGGLIARLAAKKARRRGTKVIYCAHGFHFFTGAPLINWILYYPLEKLLARFTDVIFTVNKEDYQRAKAKFTKKADVCLLPGVGVNFERLNVNYPSDVRKKYRKELNIDEKTTALVYIAEILPNKNQKMLVDVLQILLNKGKDVCLVLPGPDHAEGELAGYIESKGLSEYVRLLGWRSDIGELLYACDICTASSIREGFGINLVEAMYCGLPVVATRNRGHEMIIKNGENGFLVDINDVDTMADRINEIIENGELRKQFSVFDVKQYDCDLIATQLFIKISEYI